MIKKINAVLSLITIPVLIAHIGTAFGTLEGKELPAAQVLSLLSIILVVLHAVLSMLIIFLVHDDSAIRYPKQNLTTVLQRVSGVLLLVFLLVAHINVYSADAPNGILYGIGAIGFYLSLAVHMASSVPKAFITLGILRGERSLMVVKIIFAAVSLFLMVDGILLTVRTVF